MSQLVRSPEHDRPDKNSELYGSTLIPNRGVWLEYETDSKTLLMYIDRTRKIPLTVLVRALGFGSDDLIQEIFGDETLRLTWKDVHKLVGVQKKN